MLYIKFNVGDVVFWHDPEEDFSSGYYEVVVDSGDEEVYDYVDSIYLIHSLNGVSEAEVWRSELSLEPRYEIKERAREDDDD